MVHVYLGIYTGGGTPDDDGLFITEKHCFQDLISGLGTPCSCGMVRNTWTLESVIQVLAYKYLHYNNILTTVLVFFYFFCRKAMFYEHCFAVAGANVSAKHGQVLVCLVDNI